MLLGRSCPMNLDATLSRILFELFQVVREFGQRMPLDLGGRGPQLLPFGYAAGSLIAFRADKPECLVVPLGTLGIIYELGRSHGVIVTFVRHKKFTFRWERGARRAPRQYA